MRLAWVGLLLTAVGCGKHPVDSSKEQPHWDPPTVANGFHPIVSDCVIVHSDKIPVTQNGSLETVASVDRPRAVASDGQAIYWVDGSDIHRAIRGASWAEPWLDGVVATAGRGESVVDLAATRRYVYWTTIDRNGEHVLHAWEPATAQTKRIMAGGIGALSARSDRLTSLGDRELVVMFDSDRVTRTPILHPDTKRVFTTDGDSTIVWNHESFFARVPPPGSIPTTLAAAVDPVDAFCDGSWLYWLERGPARVTKPEECIPHGYESGRVSHPKGKLRRVGVHGGPVHDLFLGIPDPEALMVSRGIVWITTRNGLLRYDPSGQLPPVRIAAASNVHGRAAAVGDALVVMTDDQGSHVALLAQP